MRTTLAVIPGRPGLYSNTPIYDGLHDEIWPREPVRYISDADFERIYAKEKHRWAELADRLKASGD